MKFIRVMFSIVVMTYFFMSCSRIDDVVQDTDIKVQDVETLMQTYDALQEASEKGKVIADVRVEDGIWIVTFSDSTSINITQEGNGVTPFLYVDHAGYWTVSYDKLRTFTKVFDNQGNHVCGMGPYGELDVMVKAVVNDNGYYTCKLYDSRNPDIAFESVKTPFEWNSSRIITSITLDKVSDTVTFLLSNDDSFTFSYQVCKPSEIELMSTDEFVLCEGDTVVVEFNVHPSDASLNYDLESEYCEIALGLVSENRSDVTASSNYRLFKVEPAYDEQGAMRLGRYRAFIKDSGVSKSYRDVVSLVISTEDEDGQIVEVASPAIDIQYRYNVITGFRLLKKDNPKSLLVDVEAEIDGNKIKVKSPYITSLTGLVACFESNGCVVEVNGRKQESGVTGNDFSDPLIYTVVDQDGNAEPNEYKVEVIHSGLPVVYIDTPGSAPIKSKKTWTSGVTMKIVNPDCTVSYEGTMSMKGRGNSTWSYPKKPYALKLDEKSSVLGMPKHKRWVLLANWQDRTLLRNSVAFRLGECTQMKYTPRGEYVELVLNGKHLGNYFICEQIKIDENRVDITEITPTSEDITGGYLLELDKNYDEQFKFRSSVKDFPYMFKDPDEGITDAMFDYVQGYVNSMEDLLYNNFDSGKWKDFIDLESFIDFWFASELTGVKEPSHPKSIFMHKDRGGKLCAGPMWDYDWDTFIPGRANAYVIRKYLYYPVLFKDKEFVEIVKERWPSAKEKFDKIPAFIDSEMERLRNSNAINNEMWPITKTVNGDEHMSYDEAVARMKKAYVDKLEWLDNQIKNM